MNEIPLTEMETQLRALMNAAVGDPPRRITAEAVRRGAARRRLMAQLAVSAAIIAFGGIGAALAAQSGGPGPSGVTGSPRANPPRYYIVQSFGPHRFQTAVRTTANGAVTATVHCPSAAPDISVSSVTPAAHETFFLVCDKTTLTEPRSVLSFRIYRFQITSAGRISGYTPVRGGTMTGLSDGSVAVTPDGSEIAVAVSPGGVPQGGIAPPEVIVINTGTGSHAIWHGAPDTPGTIRYPVYDLSLTANGKEMAFLSQPRCLDKKKFPSCKVTGGEEMRAVYHARGGGRLASARVIFRQAWLMRLAVGYINDAVLTPDGSSATVAEVDWPLGHVSIASVSAATGRQVAVIYRVSTGNGFSYRAFSADASGRWLLLDVGPSSGSINGWIDHGKLIRLKPAGDSVAWEVW